MIQQSLLSLPQTENTSDDYYTPKWLFDRMAISFDIDVCAPEGGISWIPAATHFSMADDGLTQPWRGRVWMNPPYSDVTPWWARFVQHRDGIALLPLAKSCWLNEVWGTADAVVLDPDTGGMKFHRPDAKTMRIWFPVLLAAFGAESVEAIGRVGPLRLLASTTSL